MAVKVRAIEGDTVDKICHQHYGRTQGTTEKVLKANPGLAALGPILPSGTLVTLPDDTRGQATKKVRLWN